jgi:SCP-2 sterol transfer family
VYENLRSPATYLNRTRAGTTPVPEVATGTGASTPPRWHRISGSHTARWHDHRVHWMGTSPPAAVRADPGAFHTVNPAWTVGLRYGSTDVAVRGRLDWVPGPSGLPWLPLVAGLFVLGVVVARSRSRAALITAVVALVAVDIAHSVGAEAARAGALVPKTLQFLGDNFVSVIVWVLAGATIWAIRRRRAEALYGVLLVGAMVALVSGLTDLSYLWKSQLPAVGPANGARAEVAIALSLGLGLAAGAASRLARSSRDRVPPAARDPHWVERLVDGLDDDAVARESVRLDAADVVPMALTDLAPRLAPVAAEFGSEALVFVVLAQDDVGSHVWSIVAAPLGTGGVRVQRGRPAPARAELRVTFPAFLQLLGGTVTFEQLVAAGRLLIDGDASFVASVEPLLAAAPGRPLAAGRGQ